MDTLGVLWTLPIVGVAELIGGIGLIAALFDNRLSGIASLWVSAIMIGAVIAHLRVGDFLGSIVPIIFLIPSLTLVYVNRHTFPIRLLEAYTNNLSKED